MNLIKEVRAAWVAREIKRLLPKQTSHKTEGEPVAQRQNPQRAAKKAARRAKP